MSAWADLAAQALKLVARLADYLTAKNEAHRKAVAQKADIDSRHKERRNASPVHPPR